MKFGVIIFPGSNCDQDMVGALRNDLGQEVIELWHKDNDLSAFTTEDCIILPGGFSFGDYLRCGAIARFSPMMQQTIAFAQRGGKVFGVCNGFQILTEAHLLPGALRRNQGLKFIHRTVTLQDAKNKQTLSMPIAHHDGCYLLDPSDLARLQDQDGIAYRYTDNPNGSVDDIAGVFNETKTVLGLMPHPERAVDPDLGTGTDGRRVIASFLG
jgi:phosphoribosylformylglycinamidine synthase